MPTQYELGTGKTFSCMCGGLPGDASTEWACKQQPLTYWVFTMLPQNSSNSSTAAKSPFDSAQQATAPHSRLDSFGGFLTSAKAAASQQTKVDFHVVERGGTMSIDLNPHDFQYAFAGVWEGNFTGCTFSTGACTRPLEGDDCFVATCEGGGVVCPPPCECLLYTLPAHKCLLWLRQMKSRSDCNALCVSTLAVPASSALLPICMANGLLLQPCWY